MSGLNVKMLGKPEVKTDKKKVQFPYKKVEALLYYLLLEKEVNRNKAASLLWGDMPESSAKKNLRNALYQLRKCIGKEFILSPGRFKIKINNKININCDLNKFLNNNSKEKIDIYRGEFLQNFNIKDSLEYSDWLREQRDYLHKIYIEALKERIGSLKKEGENNEKLIKYLNYLIEADIFNEDAYRQLMQIYSEKGDIARAMNIYNKLKDILNRELGITPAPRTVALKERLTFYEKKTTKIEKDFIGRKKELNFLLDNLYKFKENERCSSIFISGEAGIGKTTLMEKALSISEQEDESLVIKSECFPAEERYIYKPWKKVMENIKENIELKKIDSSLPWKRIMSFLFPSFLARDEMTEDILNFESIQHQSAIDAFIYLLTEVAKEEKLILVFENLQWFDKKSLELVKSVIRADKNERIVIIATTRNERTERLNELFSSLYREELLKNLELPRFTKKGVKTFCQIKIPDYDFNSELLDVIYRETEGNTFFMVEALKFLTPDGNKKDIEKFMTTKTRNILRERVLSVPCDARKLLNIIAIPFDKISFGFLCKISGMDKVKIIDLLETLTEYNLIEEIPEEKYGRIFYHFTHAKLREYIYQNLSHSRLRLLHEKFAAILEKNKNVLDEREYYSRLIYHYSCAGNKYKQLQYILKEAEIYFHRSHELFPVINDKKIQKNEILALNQKESYRYLKEIEELFSALKKEDDKNYEQMEVKLLDMWALFSIVQGNYDKALSCVRQMIDKAARIGDLESIINGYEQLAGLGIQKEDLNLIEDSARKMYELAKKLNKNIKMGIALRFLGIYEMYRKNYRSSEENFNKALQIFKNAELGSEKYTIGIAAIYNYIGEIKRHRGQFTEALNYYERCIGLCEGKNILCGLGVFYTNAGQVSYELKKYELAEKHFLKAVNIFGQLKTVWGYSSLPNSFLALLALKKGKYYKASEYLKMADLTLKKYHKRYWQGILLRVKAEIVELMKKNQKIKEVFNDYLEEDGNYKIQARDIFADIGATYEVELME